MGAFDSLEETIEIHHPSWDANEVVIARATPTLEDEEWVNNQVLKLTQGERSKGQLDIESNMGSVRRLWIERMVKSWTFTKNGLPVPFTSKSLKQLPTAYSDYIYEQINAAAPQLDAEEADDFLAGAGERTQEA